MAWTNSSNTTSSYYYNTSYSGTAYTGGTAGSNFSWYADSLTPKKTVIKPEIPTSIDELPYNSPYED